MKTIFTLRTLTVFSFVIFFLPFMRTCSDEDLMKMERQAVEVDQDGNEINSPTPNTANDEKYKEELSQKKKNATFNFYSISTLVFQELNFDNIQDKSDLAKIGFTVILFTSVLILFFSFTNKFKITSLLGIANLLILFCATLFLYLSEIIENLNQIKIGYYLFVLNSILIIYFSIKLIKQQRLQRE